MSAKEVRAEKTHQRIWKGAIVEAPYSSLKNHSLGLGKWSVGKTPVM